MKSWSLRAQIVVLVLSLVAITLAIVGGTTYARIRNQMIESLIGRGIGLSQVMSESVGNGIELSDREKIDNVISSMFSDKDVRGVAVFDADTTLIDSRVIDERLKNLAEVCNQVDSITVEHEHSFTMIESPIKVGRSTIGCLWLALSEEHVVAETRTTLWIIIIGAMILFGLAGVVCSVVTARLVRPIQMFEEAAGRVGFGDMVSPVQIDELQKDFRPLGLAFNEMQVALKEAFTALAHSRDQLEVQVGERTRELREELAERQLTEQALKFTQFAVDHGADPAYWMTSDGRFIYVNEAACSSLGYTRDELKNLTIFDVDAVMNEELWELHWIDVRQRGSFTMESTHKRKSGETFPVELAVNYMEYEGREYNCVFTRDLTDRKRVEERRQELQEQLERAQRMESLGILAGGVAHDLNNMLGPVVGYTELMLLGLKKDDKLRTRVERIAKSASAAADVIQDLLALARRGRYEMAPVALNEIVTQYLDSPSFIKLREQRPDVQVELNLDDRVRNLVGSEPHLAKVVMNLVVNAFDAMPEGGKIKISTELEYLEDLYSRDVEITPGRYLVLRVSDTGQGIAPEDLDRIFEPYYSKKKLGKSGSGLGLSVVYGIVKDHKGFYDIESKIGSGTEFILYFPATQERRQPEESNVDDFTGSETVLVVDDTPEQRDIARELLESLGYTVFTVNNGHEALEYLKQHEVDVVALDMLMEEGFDGLDTYRHIIKAKPDQNTIVMSGYSSTQRVEEMQRLGAGAYVKKPFTRETLGRAIREALETTDITVVK